MPLLLSRASREDVPAFYNLYAEAFQEKLSLTMFPRSLHFQKWWNDNNFADMASQSTAHFLKVTDSDTGKIVGYAKWDAPAKSSSEWADGPPPEWPADANKALCDEFFGQLGEKRKVWMGDRKHWFLELICTVPEYQGRGVGSLLLRWGLEQADRDGVEAYLDASPKGAPIYEHFGWVTQDRVVVLDGGYTQLVMIRPVSK